MKKLLNTVYITTEGAALRKDGENLVADVEGVEKARVPLHMLASVVAFGAVYASPALMGAAPPPGSLWSFWSGTAGFWPGSKVRCRATCSCGGRSIGRRMHRRKLSAPS